MCMSARLCSSECADVCICMYVLGVVRGGHGVCICVRGKQICVHACVHVLSNVRVCWDGWSLFIQTCAFVYQFVYECLCVCVRACMFASMRVCARTRTGVYTLLVCCLTSQQQASVSQGWICSDNFTCCYTETEVADQTFYLTQSQYTDTGPTSPSADPITPGAWQGSHWSANF